MAAWGEPRGKTRKPALRRRPPHHLGEAEVVRDERARGWETRREELEMERLELDRAAEDFRVDPGFGWWVA